MKNRGIVIILAFLLGGFGVHRFYLGQIGKGIVYLLFCWTFIPAFIAIIDIIMFAIMSEEKFNANYNSSSSPKTYTHQSSQKQPQTNRNSRSSSYFPESIQGTTIQVLESVHIIANSKSFDTVKGRIQFVEERKPELKQASYNPRYLSDVQTGIDRYKEMYYDKIPSDFELFSVTNPNEFKWTEFYCRALVAAFEKHLEEQEEQISNLKRENAITARREKMMGLIKEIQNELDMKCSHASSYDDATHKLKKYYEEQESIISPV